MALAFLLAAAMPALAAGPRVVYVDSEIYSSDLLVTTDWAGEPITVTITGCRIGPRASVTVSAQTTALVEDIAYYQCSGTSVGLFEPVDDSPFGAVKMETLVTFRDELGNLAAFSIPVLQYDLTHSGKLEAEGIRNDGRYSTAVILFNEFPELVHVTATVYDERGAVAGRETIALPGSTHTLSTLSTQVRAGRVEISSGVAGIGCPGCETAVAVYGFATVNWHVGGSPRVIPLTPPTFYIAID